jgi:hypothetical protein
MYKAIAVRVLISLVVGLAAAGLISEVGFSIQETSSRPPETIELVIPPGTQEKVNRGESVLPDSMTFMVGDTLLVRNQDTEAHTLGPLYIPAGSSASLKLETPESLAYTCSFQPAQYFGLDVREPLSLVIRLEGILLAGVPMGILLAVYSLVAWPLKPKQPADSPS